MKFGAYRLLAIALLLPLLAACAHAAPQVGEVDVERLISQWPEMQKRSTEIRDARSGVESSAQYIDAQARAKAEYGLGLREAQLQMDIVRQIQRAAKVVAKRHGLRIVVTRDYVAYAGIDVTDEVRELVIAGAPDSSTPSPETRQPATQAPTEAPTETPVEVITEAPTTAAPDLAPHFAQPHALQHRFPTGE